MNQEGPVEPSIKSRLLVKAVRDCFIGRHFIFGIKVNRLTGFILGRNLCRVCAEQLPAPANQII